MSGGTDNNQLPPEATAASGSGSGSGLPHPSPVDDLPSTPPPPPRVLARDDLPADARQIAAHSPMMFDSPDLRAPPPPGASQPNAPLHMSSSSQHRSYPHPPTPSHIQPRSPQPTKRPQKFSILRKKGRSHTTPSSSAPPPVQVPTTTSPPIDDDDDEWLLEGTSNNGFVNATVSVGREASNLSRSVDTLSLAESDTGEAASPPTVPIAVPVPSTATGVLATQPEKRVSKTRSLAKKTSRLFSRNGHGSSHHQHEESSSSASLTLPAGASTMRQNSVSSNGSTDSRQKHWNLSRVNSGNKGSSPSSRENSQPSSWHPPGSFTLRRTTSHSTAETDIGVPPAGATSPVSIPQLRSRESSSHLNAFVPSLRNDSSVSIQHHTSPHQQQHSHSSLQQQNTLPSRMSSWFSNLLPANTAPADQSPPLGETAALPPSPLRKPPGVAASIFSAARNKAVGGMRYLMDSEAQPDHCQDTMWVMGVPHPGFIPEHAYEDSPTASPPSWTTRFKEGSGTYSSSPPTRTGGLGHFFGSSFNLAGQAAAAAEPSTPVSEVSSRSKKDKQKELKWPEQFYDDFRSRVWCTYRSQYAPILPLAPGQLLPTPYSYFGAFVGPSVESNLPQPGQTSTGTGQPSRLSNGPWSWVKGDERGLTSDAGWGCMLRTGQSLLANALIHIHLGRGWRLPSTKPSTTPESPLELAELEAYATYVRILSWFFDDPSPLCPFSVHRMALIGKELGKEVGEWFGPSTAAGALKTLVNSFPLCGLGVVNAVDGTIYRSDVYAASNISSDAWEASSPRRSRPSSVHRSGWGGKSVLILIGLRLGVDGVNPIYYESIKTLFTFPHSVGIAGGRPSSSYYFVASQANSLFYLDPHFTRPALPLRVPPPNAANAPGRKTASVHFSRPTSLHTEDEAEEEYIPLAAAVSHTSDSSLPTVDAVNNDPEAHEPAALLVPDVQSPTKPRRRLTLTQTLRIKPGSPSRKSSAPASPTTPTIKGINRRTSQPSPSPRPPATRHSTASSSSSLRCRTLPVDAQTAWYASAYSEANLKSFHCDKVKKLPLSGLDPSMLIGFLCQTEAEFEDFCERVAKLPQKIFTVQDEPPLWSEDEDGLESVSEPVSDLGSDREDDLDLEDVNEFGTLSRPLSAAQRDETITPLSAAAEGLGLSTHGGGADTPVAPLEPAEPVDAEDAEDADTEEEVDKTAKVSARKARRSSGASTSSQRRIARPKETDDEAEVLGVEDSTATLPARRIQTTSEFDTSDDEMPIARITRSVDSVTPQRPARPARFGSKGKGKPPQEVFASQDLDDEAEETMAPAPGEVATPIVPPRRKASLTALHQAAAAAAIDIPKHQPDFSPNSSLGPRQRTTVRNLKAIAAAQAEQAKAKAKTDAKAGAGVSPAEREPPELLNEVEPASSEHSKRKGSGDIHHAGAGVDADVDGDSHADADADADADVEEDNMSFEDVGADLASTPSSSAAVMVERPSPRSPQQ